MSRPAYKPTPESRAKVNAMAFGTPEHAIARVLKIDPKTLRKHFRDELDTAHIVANSAVGQSLYKMATGHGPQSVPAAIFWAKTRMGWRETQHQEQPWVCKRAATAVPDTLPDGRGHAGPRDCAQGAARSPDINVRQISYAV